MLQTLTYLFVHPLPKYGEQKQRSYRRTEVPLHGLDVNKQLTASWRLHQRKPQNTDSTQDQDAHTGQIKKRGVLQVYWKIIWKKKIRWLSHLIRVLNILLWLWYKVDIVIFVNTIAYKFHVGRV